MGCCIDKRVEWGKRIYMRTLKLLLPIIVNIVLIIIYVPFSLELGPDYVSFLWKSGKFRLGTGLCSITFLIILFAITIFWFTRVGKKYLTYSVYIRYLVCGIGLTGLVDGTLAICYYRACFDWYIPWLIYEIFGI